MTTVKVEVTEQQVTVSNVGIQGPPGPVLQAIVRPNGTVGGNVYANVQDAYNALEAHSDAQKKIVFDGSLNNSDVAFIEAGAYDFRDYIWDVLNVQGSEGDQGRVNLTIGPDVSGYLPRFCQGINIMHDGDPNAWILEDDGVMEFRDCRVSVTDLASSPMISVQGDAFSQKRIAFTGRQAGLGEQAGIAVIDVAASVFFEFSATAGSGTVYDNTISGSGFLFLSLGPSMSRLEGDTQAITVFEVTNATATRVAYDNSTSGLTATDVQAAIDELKALIDALP